MTQPMNAKRQFMRFLVIGVFCAVLDYGLTSTLIHVVGYDRLVAKPFGWCLGTAVAYLLNSRFTFQAKITGKHALAVFILYASTLAVQWGIFRVTEAPLIALGFEGLWKDTISFVIAQGVATITNFVLQRVLIFKQPTTIVVDEAPAGHSGSTPEAAA